MNEEKSGKKKIIWINAGTHQFAKELAKRNGCSMGELVKFVIEKWAKEEKLVWRIKHDEEKVKQDAILDELGRKIDSKNSLNTLDGKGEGVVELGCTLEVAGRLPLKNT
jgi:hypothetical protein